MDNAMDPSLKIFKLPKKNNTPKKDKKDETAKFKNNQSTNSTSTK